MKYARIRFAWLAVAGCAALLLACASLPPQVVGSSPAGLDTVRKALPLAKAHEELVGWLQAYLRIDTMNPPGNETRGANFLAEILAKEGIASQIYEFAPGRGSLVARLPAAASPTERPLCLLSHIDTVTAEAEKWPADAQPLSGARKNGEIWGRGALDMKGMGILELGTMVWLKRLKVPLRRDVVLLAVADEEVDNLGMKLLTQAHWNELGCGHLLNEGGIGLKDAIVQGQTFFAVSVAEKGLLWLKLTAHGKSGHGSTPLPGRAPDRLLDALVKIRAKVHATQVHQSLYTALAAVGRQLGGVQGYVMQRPTLVDWLALGQLEAEPGTRAAIRDTCQVTGFSGMFAPNVVPSEVSAQIDCRVLPGRDPAALLRDLKALVDDPNVDFEVLHAARATESPSDDPFFRALLRHTRALGPHVVSGPVLSVGFTDSIYARPLGVRAYGLVPVEIPRALAETMHGERERVPEASFVQGLQVLWNVVVDTAAVVPR